MADNKMYITEANEFGQILISEDVLATIAYQSLVEIEGYAGLSADAQAEFPRPLSARNWRRGIHVFVSEKGKLFMELDVLVYYGTNVSEIAEKIQNLVSDAIFSVTGQRPRRIHVNICGIIRN